MLSTRKNIEAPPYLALKTQSLVLNTQPSAQRARDPKPASAAEIPNRGVRRRRRWAQGGQRHRDGWRDGAPVDGVRVDGVTFGSETVRQDDSGRVAPARCGRSQSCRRTRGVGVARGTGTVPLAWPASPTARTRNAYVTPSTSPPTATHGAGRCVETVRTGASPAPPTSGKASGIVSISYRTTRAPLQAGGLSESQTSVSRASAEDDTRRAWSVCS